MSRPKIPLQQAIKISTGESVIIDAEDYVRLSSRSWSMRGKYPAASICGKMIYMHRFILGTPSGMLTDHINGNKLDNRKANLRIATRSQNSQNTKRPRGEYASKYKGVTWWARTNQWRARVQLAKKSYYAGFYYDEQEAACAYDAKALELFGKFAKTNKMLGLL